MPVGIYLKKKEKKQNQKHHNKKTCLETMTAQSLMQGFESKTSLFPSTQGKQAPEKCPEKDLFL